MPVIRIKDEDKIRFDFMRGLIPASSFFTLLVDKYEQPEVEEVKPKRSNPPLKKEVHPQFGRCKDIFFEYWIKRNQYDFKDWNGAHAKALNGLIKKIESSGSFTGVQVLDIFTVLMDKLPAFYHNKYLTAINSNYGSIISDIKNGGNKTTTNQDGGAFDFRN